MAPDDARIRARAVTQPQGKEDLALMGFKKGGKIPEGPQINDGQEQQGRIIGMPPQPSSQTRQETLGKVGGGQGGKDNHPD